MALYRTISLSFWTDTKIIDDFTPEDRYFYLYLFTNPHTSISGCYEISIRQMANETGYSKDTIERLLDRFKNVHKVIDYSEETKEVLLVNWHKYTWTTSEKFRKPLMADINNIKYSAFKEYLLDIFNGNAPLYRYGIDTNCIDTSVSNSITITNTETNSKKDKYLDTVDKYIEEHKYSIYISNILREWFIYKREKKQSNTETGTKKLLNKVDKVLLEYSEQDLGNVINECMERNYQGIIFDMLGRDKGGVKNGKSGNTTTKQYTDEQLERFAELL